VRTAVAIAVAGALGALARYGIDVYLRQRKPGTFPWGTLVVNVSGAFLLGLIFTAATEKWAVAPWLRSAITVGFLGAYTTFSTLTFETYRLADERELGLAAVNLLGSITAGMIAVYAGIRLGRAL